MKNKTWKIEIMLPNGMVCSITLKANITRTEALKSVKHCGGIISIR